MTEQTEENTCIVCGKNPIVGWCFWCQECIDHEEWVEENAK